MALQENTREILGDRGRYHDFLIKTQIVQEKTARMTKELHPIGKN
jgi:hypothetical protein